MFNLDYLHAMFRVTQERALLKRRRGTHVRFPPNARRRHNPAGSKMARRITRGLGSTRHMWG